MDAASVGHLSLKECGGPSGPLVLPLGSRDTFQIVLEGWLRDYDLSCSRFFVESDVGCFVSLLIAGKSSVAGDPVNV